MAPLVIFGASRGVGLELARLARHGGRPVVALVRDGSPHSELDAAGVTVVTGDVLDPQAVSVACAAAGGPFDLVSTVGGRTADGRFTDEWGNIAAVDAAAAGPCRRLVLVTSMGCGEMAPFRSERAIAAFGAAVDAKTRAEDHMRRAFPRGTAIRPAVSGRSRPRVVAFSPPIRRSTASSTGPTSPSWCCGRWTTRRLRGVSSPPSTPTRRAACIRSSLFR